MKCLKIDCEKECTPGFEACGPMHGADIRLYRSQLPDCFDADKDRELQMRALYSVEHAIIYL